MSSSKTVLITGMNGFIGVHTTLRFLQAGWNVRGTARSQPKVDAALTLPCLKKYAQGGQLTGWTVENMQNGDYSDALKGVDAVSFLSSY